MTGAFSAASLKCAAKPVDSSSIHHGGHIEGNQGGLRKRIINREHTNEVS